MQIEDFANRVRRSARHWGKWARRRGIECYRIYDRDIPEFAFALDVYGHCAHLQEYRRGSEIGGPEHEAWLAQVRETAAAALELDLDAVVLKQRVRRHGGAQHEKTGRAGREFAVQEGGHRFLVNLEAYLDTGLFLDHRTTRALVAAEASGKRFLNLFCYTASFTVYAAAAGATSSVSVDLSNTYLDWARRNFALNDVAPDQHELVRADVLTWLKEAAAANRQFDLVVLDPPSFSTSKAMTGVLDVQRDYPTLLADCARLLAPTGALYFSTNLAGFKFDPERVPALSGEDISQRTVPEDFRNRRIHRCWRFTRATPR